MDMPDIVERLKETADDYGIPACDHIMEAAAEITRLRAELAAVRAAENEACAKILENAATKAVESNSHIGRTFYNILTDFASAIRARMEQ